MDGPFFTTLAGTTTNKWKIRLRLSLFFGKGNRIAGYKRDGDIYHFLLRQLETVVKKLKC